MFCAFDSVSMQAPTNTMATMQIELSVHSKDPRDVHWVFDSFLDKEPAPAREPRGVIALLGRFVSP